MKHPIVSFTTGTNKDRNDDAIMTLAHPEGTILALADGATGSGYGYVAARHVCARAAHLDPVEIVSGAFDLEGWISDLDRELKLKPRTCDTTLVITAISNGTIRGASVGDSTAWLFDRNGDVATLTERQHPRPRIGGGCWPATLFGPTDLGEKMLLVASDGLVPTALSFEDVSRIVQEQWSELVPEALRHAASGNGQYADDFSAICVLAQP